jgi:hypothetical protein
MYDVHAAFLEKTAECEDVPKRGNGQFPAQAEVHVELVFAYVGKSLTHRKHVDLHGSGA